MAITSSHKSQFRQCELPTSNTNHIFLENKPLGDNDLFFLYLLCTYLPAYEPALSKESIESKKVNTPSKSSRRSHSCT